MKIILNQDVPNLGEEGDVCVVKDGYARNYLLPSGAAVAFTKANQALFASRTAAIEKRKTEKREAARSLKEKLDNLSISLTVSAGDSGKLFGSVTSAMVQDALAKQGLEIEKKKIEVASHTIKMVGTYSVKIRLYENETSSIKLIVESETEVKKKVAAEAKAEKEAKVAPAVEEVPAEVEEVAPQAEEVVETAESAETTEVDA